MKKGKRKISPLRSTCIFSRLASLIDLTTGEWPVEE
jgi:hypothetical protein